MKMLSANYTSILARHVKQQLRIVEKYSGPNLSTAMNINITRPNSLLRCHCHRKCRQVECRRFLAAPFKTARGPHMLCQKRWRIDIQRAGRSGESNASYESHWFDAIVGFPALLWRNTIMGTSKFHTLLYGRIRARHTGFIRKRGSASIGGRI